MSGVTMAPRAIEEQQGKSRLSLITVLLSVFTIGGAYYAWTSGMLAPGAVPVASEGETTDPDTTISTGPDVSTREGFLTAQSTAPCVYATRIAAGPNSGTINALADDITVFDGLLDAYDAAFNARPTVLAQPVTAEQCAALDLADSLRTVGGASPVLTLDNTVMTSGGSLVGKLSDRRGRTVWLALVSAAGGVYNLTDRLTEQADGSATFNFGLEAEAGSDPSPQLLIAIASNSPLIAATVATDGTPAETLLPLIEAEIAGRSEPNAGASIGVFALSP